MNHMGTDRIKRPQELTKIYTHSLYEHYSKGPRAIIIKVLEGLNLGRSDGITPYLVITSFIIKD